MENEFWKITVKFRRNLRRCIFVQFWICLKASVRWTFQANLLEVDHYRSKFASWVPKKKYRKFIAKFRQVKRRCIFTDACPTIFQNRFSQKRSFVWKELYFCINNHLRVYKEWPVCVTLSAFRAEISRKWQWLRDDKSNMQSLHGISKIYTYAGLDLRTQRTYAAISMRSRGVANGMRNEQPRSFIRIVQRVKWESLGRHKWIF